MTSNLGSKHIAKESVGFKRQSTDEEWDDKKSKVEESLSNHFRPEFLNRIDEIIIFDSLEEKNLLEIVGIVVSKVKLRMKDLGVNIVIYGNHLLRSAYPSMVKTAESILKHDRCLEASEKYCMPIKEIITLIPEEY